MTASDQSFRTPSQPSLGKPQRFGAAVGNEQAARTEDTRRAAGRKRMQIGVDDWVLQRRQRSVRIVFWPRLGP